MIAGLPGTGIGGLFYLLSALVMPLVELVRLLLWRKRTSNWKLVFSQFALAVGIIVAFSLTGLILNYLFPVTVGLLKTYAPKWGTKSQNVNLGVAPTAITLSVLALYLVSIELIGFAYVKLNPKKFISAPASENGQENHN